MMAASHVTVEGVEGVTTFGEVRMLVQRWREARFGDRLPAFEDIAVGHLGAVVDDIAIITIAETGQTVSRMGDGFQRTLAVKTRAFAVEDLSANFGVPIQQAVRSAVLQGGPVLTTARCLVEGSVGVCEFLALPLRARWNETLVLGFLRQRPVTQDLIDAVYRATADGLLALAAIENGPTGLDFQIVSLNASAAAFLGRPEADLCWTMLSSHLRLPSDRTLLQRLGDILNRGGAEHFELTLTGFGGQPAHFQVSAAPVGDLLALALSDVTVIRKREESVRLLFEHNPMPLMLCDPTERRVLEANDACLALLGYAAEALKQVTPHDLYGADAGPAAEAMFGPSVAGEGHIAVRHQRSDGRMLETLVYRRNLPFGDRICVLASIVDVTEQRLAEARIAHLAHHDGLTGLANRTLFKSSLVRHLAEAARNGLIVAVHCLDLDRFKQVNDTFGHPTGDALLAQVAQRLRGSCRVTDLIARLGGDEFAIIQIGLSVPTEASALADRLLHALSAPYVIDGQHMTVGASIGIALGLRDSSDPDVLLKSADIALYRSKADGRGGYAFFQAEMDRALRGRRRLEQDLRDAMGKGEFRLVYQPTVDVANRRIVGCEALLRWNHPERGLVSPLDFIPTAEETGLIVPLGDWVMRTACAEAALWPSDVGIAVNLSPIQFSSPHLVASVVSALASSGLPASRLELEITETVLLAENSINLAALRQLRALGVHVAIDDFGTGYSSLGYLRSFPVDKLKIDRSFVTGLPDDRGSRAIVKAVIGLAADLGITSQAEGVETAEQLDLLAAAGCDMVQGYLLGRPIAPEALRPLFEAQRRSHVMAA